MLTCINLEIERPSKFSKRYVECWEALAEAHSIAQRLENRLSSETLSTLRIHNLHDGSLETRENSWMMDNEESGLAARYRVTTDVFQHHPYPTWCLILV
jgi:hypothetical protein